MNDPTPGGAPEQPGTPYGHRPVPGPPRPGPDRRPLGAPGGAVPPGEGDTPEESGVPGPYGTEPPAEPADPGPGATGPEDDGPQPLGLRVEPTGHAPVDAQLRRLEDADHLAVSGHLEVYEDVHRGLRDTLTALDRNESRS